MAGFLFLVVDIGVVFITSHSRLRDGPSTRSLITLAVIESSREQVGRKVATSEVFEEEVAAAGGGSGAATETRWCRSRSKWDLEASACVRRDLRFLCELARGRWGRTRAHAGCSVFAPAVFPSVSRKGWTASVQGRHWSRPEDGDRHVLEDACSEEELASLTGGPA